MCVGVNKLHTAFLFGKGNKQDMKNCGKMQLDCRVNNNDAFILCSNSSVSSVWVPKVNTLPRDIRVHSSYEIQVATSNSCTVASVYKE